MTNYIKKNKIKIGLLIIIVSIFIISRFTSFASYNDIVSFTILHSKIGNKSLINYDYILYIYLEDGLINNEKHYALASEIPIYGYTYSGYICQNDSSIIYDDLTKEAIATVDKKDECSMYFDLTN